MYVRDLLKTYDVICLQEHWLRDCERDEFREYAGDCCCTIKCMDDEIPNFLDDQVRGHAGTAILWKEELKDIVEPVTDGSHRVSVVRLNRAQDTPILLINTYMPSQGTKTADHKDTLDEVYEIITKYPECTPIWTGDINTDITRNKLTSNDKNLLHFCNENGLGISPCMPDSPTYHHFDNTSTSRIDLYIHKASEDPIDNIHILARDPTNTSPHDAVIATINGNFERMIEAKNQAPKKRVIWEKVDKLGYKEQTEVRLTSLIQCMENMPASIVTQRLNKILNQCALNNCPNPPKHRRRAKYRWHSSLKPLAQTSKKAYLDHKRAQNHQDKQQLKAKATAAKRTLRKAQRQLAAQRRRDVKNGIITACQSADRQEFFRAVRKQRNSSKRKAQVEFGLHHKETVAESWASYFEKLATPTDDETFDDEYNRHLETAYLLQSLNNNRQPLPPVGTEDVMQIVKKLKMGKAKDVFGISSEHIRFAAEPIFTVLTYLLNEVLRTGKLPDEYKLGTICPVPKKSKSARLPTNYRRITITSIVGKVAEIHIVNLMRKTADPIQSPLQFGFTSGISPNFAALIVSEVMNQAKSNKSPLYLALMDT